MSVGGAREHLNINVLLCSILAHLNRRLTGEFIVYPCSGVRPSVRPSVVRRS